MYYGDIAGAERRRQSGRSEIRLVPISNQRNDVLRRWMLGLIVLAAGSGVGAEWHAMAQPQRPPFRAGVDLVSLSVTVVDGT
jgi:hypothetical protein